MNYFSTIRIIIWGCFICYLLQTLFYPVIENLYALRYIGNDNFATIQFVTYSFLHADPLHLIVNMIMLILFGSKIELFFGKMHTISLFIVGAIGGALFQTISNMLIINSHFGTPFPVDTTNDLVGKVLFALENGSYINSVFVSHTLGASASVFAFMVAFTILFPHEKFNLVLIPFNISARIFVLVYIVIEFYNAFNSPQFSMIAHFAHLGGAFFGLVYAYIVKLKYSI